MPRFRSVKGLWFPVKEHYINDKAKPGEESTYEGPDRAATEMLDELGVDHLGEDCMMTEETIIKARNLGMDTPREYLKQFKNVDIDANEKEQKELLKEEVHLADGSIFNKPKKKSKPVNPPSGGQNTAPGSNKSLKGGFGDPDEVDGGQLGKRA